MGYHGAHQKGGASMNTAAAANFADTEVEPSALGIEPLYPSWITRLV
jgi:hypothetical protein